MRYLHIILTCMIIFLPHLAKAEREPPLTLPMDDLDTVVITSPITGQVIQGGIVILGSSTLDGFLDYEVDFADAADPTQTWFLILESTSSIKDGILAVWDTSTINDGDYSLRLVVELTNGDKVEVYVANLHVRNYTWIETETPTPVQPFITLVPSIPTDIPSSNSTPTRATILLPSTITPLPTNQAEISSIQVLLTFGKGALFTVGLFTLLGAYLGIRAILYNRK